MNPYRTSPLSVTHAAELLARAGVGERVAAVRPCAGGVSNLNYEVTLANGRRILLRRYASEDGTARRVEAEIARVLPTFGLRVPKVIAAPIGRPDIAVFEWIDGVRLRDTGADASAPELESTWWTAGDELRQLHALPLTHVGIDSFSALPRPSPGEWSGDQAQVIRESGAALLAKGLIDERQRGRIEAIANLTLSIIDRFPPSLIHGDAHAANALVRRLGDQWEFAAWIDWERASVGDPEMDLAVFEVFSRAQVGAVPDAFWRGYGRRPESRFRLYELELVLFLATLDQAQRLPPGREARRVVVGNLEDLLVPLE